MKKVAVFVILIIFIILSSALVVGLTWIFLNPVTFWQKLAMLPVSIIECIGMVLVVIKVFEAVDR